MNNNNQTIKCNVSSCKYNENDAICSLHEIKVGCMKGCHPTKIEETVCDSYENMNHPKFNC